MLERRELLREFDDAIEELGGTFLGMRAWRIVERIWPGSVTTASAWASARKSWRTAPSRRRVVADDDRAPGAPVEPLVDGADPAGAYDLEQAGVDEDVDVVGDRRLRPIEGGGQLGDRRCPLEDEVEDQARTGSAIAFSCWGVSAVTLWASS